jgi:hypothetical protein
VTAVTACHFGLCSFAYAWFSYDFAGPVGTFEADILTDGELNDLGELYYSFGGNATDSWDVCAVDNSEVHCFLGAVCRRQHVATIIMCICCCVCVVCVCVCACVSRP